MMMIGINKRYKKVARRVWFIDGDYYDNKGRLINPDNFYIVEEHKKKFFMRSTIERAKLPDNKLKWRKVRDLTKSV